MTASIFTSPPRATDTNGNTVSGAKWYFYNTGTTTPHAIYADGDLTTPLTNPVVADSGGLFPSIYTDPAVVYRAVLKTALGVTVMDIDPYISPGFLDADLQGNLASTAPAKGASLIGKVGGGTVQDHIDAWSTKNYGALAAGTTLGVETSATFSGDAGGASGFYGQTRRVYATGAESLTVVRNTYFGTDIQTTGGTTNQADGLHSYVWLHDDGNVNYVRGISSHLRIDGDGGVLQTAYGFNTVDLTLGSGTGTIEQFTGFACGQIGHATRVKDVIGFSASALVGYGTVIGFSSQVTAGASKWNLFLDGTASNFIEGNIRFGATSLVANGTGGVTWGTAMAPGSGSIAVQEWAQVLGTGGAVRYVPLMS